jgi:hypothetical protein
MDPQPLREEEINKILGIEVEGTRSRRKRFRSTPVRWSR